MKFKREFLQKLIGFYWGKEGIDTSKTEVILDELDGHSRWSVSHRLVFKFENKFYETCYNVAATEGQEETPFEYDGDKEGNIECKEVFPVEKKVIAYEEKDGKDITMIPIHKWGKDHWSLLGYLGIRWSEYNGTINKEHMRCNPNKHFGESIGGNIYGQNNWKPEYGTRLLGFFEEESPERKRRLQLNDHDDYDCLDDLEKAGFVKNIGTGLNPMVKLTNIGIKIESQLRKHKANGGTFNNFASVVEL